VTFLPSCECVDEIGEAVQVGDDRALGFEPALGGRGHPFAFGAADHGPREVERGGDPVLPRQDELARRLESRGDVVDDRLQCRDHVGGHA
jgi:hypothetical protein